MMKKKNKNNDTCSFYSKGDHTEEFLQLGLVF